MNKKLFFEVFHTLHPQIVQDMLKYANSQRYTMKNDNVADNSIVLTDEWAAELANLEVVSKAKGRMSMLLKKKSKITVERKDKI